MTFMNIEVIHLFITLYIIKLYFVATFRSGLGHRGPSGNIIARGRPSFAAQLNLPH
jgi:hypothetical protein